MKRNNLFAALFLIIVLTSALCPLTAIAASVTEGARFGTADMGCTGRGICTTSAANGTTVTFALIDANTLQFSFSMADLQSHQQDQVLYFQASNYQFDAPCPLNDQIFSDWNLQSGAKIDTTSQNPVTIMNGWVYVTCTITYPQ